MRHHMTNEDATGLVIDVGDETILVAADVEYRELTDGIGVRIRLSYVNQIGPFHPFSNSKPVVKRRFSVGVLASKVAKRLPADHVHTDMLSI